MAATDFPIPRELLAAFLSDERTIRAFEQMGEVLGENTEFIEIIRGIADNAYVLGFAAAAQIGGTPAPDMLIAMPADGEGADQTLIPVPAASPQIVAGDGLTGGAEAGNNGRFDMEFPTTAGTYTPGIVPISNITGYTAYPCQWQRVGNVVSVSGKVDLEPASAAGTILGLALPVASNLSATEQLAGTANTPAAAGMAAAIYADTTDDTAWLRFVATDTANRSWFFTFMYQVI